MLYVYNQGNLLPISLSLERLNELFQKNKGSIYSRFALFILETDYLSWMNLGKTNEVRLIVSL